MVGLEIPANLRLGQRVTFVMPQRYLRHGSGLDLRILQAADSTSTALNARVPPLGTCTFHGLERIQSLGRRRPRGECGGHELSVLGSSGLRVGRS